MDNRDSILQQLDDIKLRVEQILDEYDPHHTCSLNTRKSMGNRIKKLIANHEKKRELSRLEIKYVKDDLTDLSSRTEQLIYEEELCGSKTPDLNQFQQMYVDTEAALEKFKGLVYLKVKLHNSQFRSGLQLAVDPEQETNKVKRRNKSSKHKMDSNLQAFYLKMDVKNIKMEKEINEMKKDLEVHKTRLKNLTKEHEEAAAKAKEADKLKQQLEKVTKKHQALQLVLKGGGSALSHDKTKHPLSKDLPNDSSSTNMPTQLPISIQRPQKPLIAASNTTALQQLNEGTNKLNNTAGLAIKDLSLPLLESTKSFMLMSTEGKKATVTTLPKVQINTSAKLPELRGLDVLREIERNNISPQISQQQLLTPEQATQTLLSLYDSHQLSSQLLASDHMDILETLTTDPISSLTEPDQIEKTSCAIVEYTNIIQIIKEIDVIVNEQCKQESREYQHVINKEENSRKVITEQYFSFMDTLVSTVDCANKQLLKDGITRGQINGTNPNLFWLKGTYQDFITTVEQALRSISQSSSLYLQHLDTSIKEQYKRLKGLERANPKIYKKSVQRLDKASQLPKTVSKCLDQGIAMMDDLLDQHTTGVKNEVEVFRCVREKLITDARLKMQAPVSRIMEAANKITHSGCKQRSDIVAWRLQNALKELKKLCNTTRSAKIVRECTKKITNNAKVIPFSENMKQTLKDVQQQIKDILHEEMGVKIPDQLDYEVTENATFDMQTSASVLPSHSVSLDYDQLEQKSNLLNSFSPYERRHTTTPHNMESCDYCTIPSGKSTNDVISRN